MIQNSDRSGWFGASDTSYVIGNRETRSFKKWWLEKLGMAENSVNTKAMRTGTAYEHAILDTIPGIRKDHQITIPELRLRVNYDGDLDGTIYEVKTHSADKPFRISKQYWRQAQVEMYAMRTDRLYIVSYALEPEDYRNYFREINPERMGMWLVEYDLEWINEGYLPSLKYLVKCLKEGRMPK